MTLEMEQLRDCIKFNQHLINSASTDDYKYIDMLEIEQERLRKEISSLNEEENTRPKEGEMKP